MKCVNVCGVNHPVLEHCNRAIGKDELGSPGQRRNLGTWDPRDDVGPGLVCLRNKRFRAEVANEWS